MSNLNPHLKSHIVEVDGGYKFYVSAKARNVETSKTRP